jgi:hypothetical protein
MPTDVGTAPDPAFEAARRASRQAYELGRLTSALLRAAGATVAVGLVCAVALGVRSLAWLPLVPLVVLVTEWRGGFLMKGARRGLVAGVASTLLPLSLLRPCCGMDAKAMGMDCCVMPSACWGAGAVVGLLVALALPKAPAGRRAEAAAGLLLGVSSVALTRCSMLFVGEAAGLLGGMAAGVIATSLAKAWLGGRTARA